MGGAIDGEKKWKKKRKRWREERVERDGGGRRLVDVFVARFLFTFCRLLLLLKAASARYCSSASVRPTRRREKARLRVQGEREKKAMRRSVSFDREIGSQLSDLLAGSADAAAEHDRATAETRAVSQNREEKKTPLLVRHQHTGDVNRFSEIAF